MLQSADEFLLLKIANEAPKKCRRHLSIPTHDHFQIRTNEWVQSFRGLRDPVRDIQFAKIQAVNFLHTLPELAQGCQDAARMVHDCH